MVDSTWLTFRNGVERPRHAKTLMDPEKKARTAADAFWRQEAGPATSSLNTPRKTERRSACRQQALRDRALARLPPGRTRRAKQPFGRRKTLWSRGDTHRSAIQRRKRSMPLPSLQREAYTKGIPLRIPGETRQARRRVAYAECPLSRENQLYAEAALRSLVEVLSRQRDSVELFRPAGPFRAAKLQIHQGQPEHEDGSRLDSP